MKREGIPRPRADILIFIIFGEEEFIANGFHLILFINRFRSFLLLGLASFLPDLDFA